MELEMAETDLRANKLQEIRKRCDKAMTGPWKSDGADEPSVDAIGGHAVAHVFAGQSVRPSELGKFPSLRRANAEFIAHAREDVPFLLNEIEELSAALAAVQQETKAECAKWMQHAADCSLSKAQVPSFASDKPEFFKHFGGQCSEKLKHATGESWWHCMLRAGHAGPHRGSREKKSDPENIWESGVCSCGLLEHLKALSAPKAAPRPEATRAASSQDDLPANIPCWRCKTCGCCWRDNLDGTVSLWNAVAKSCALCEADTLTACAIYWIGVPGESIAVAHARKQGAADGFQTGWHAALTRSDEATKELRALVPAPPGGLVDHLQGDTK